VIRHRQEDRVINVSRLFRVNFSQFCGAAVLFCEAFGLFRDIDQTGEAAIRDGGYQTEVKDVKNSHQPDTMGIFI
jgi:hypothetical protein